MSNIKPSQMSQAAFVDFFGGVFEHSPWVAEQAFLRGVNSASDEHEALHAALCAVFRAAERGQRLTVLRAHPDLAGRLAAAKRLTIASASEQSAAGLDALTDDERSRFIDLNSQYTTRFGFPFILAVRGRNKFEILSLFERRIKNDPETEFETACREVEQIAAHRLRGLLQEK
ncbi:MAG: 2-oxo-4-hydroxy-4-carboxy-5-ureidoimidazoline decarboxylase [Hyphomicrobiaceae bacterium]